MALLDGMIAWWKLDEQSGVREDSFGANDLADNNTVGFDTGKKVNAAKFIHTNSEYLSIADNADLSFADDDFTFAGWFQLNVKDTPADFQSLLGKLLATDREYRLGYLESTDRFVFDVATGAATSARVPADNLGSPSTGVLYFIVIWHDKTANTINIQVNNGTVNSLAHTVGCRDGANPFLVGSDSDNNYSSALADEVGCWGRVLTADERTQLYNSGNGLSFPDFSASPSASPSVSPSASVSPSPSASVSPSPSASQSPSSSVSLSPSATPSSSISPSPSASQSPSSSESPSPSRSPSLSPSATPSPSPSTSVSPSPSISVSASISPSQPPGSGLFSKEALEVLPTNKDDLAIIYGEEDETDVATDNDVRVGITGLEPIYLAHQFRIVNNTNKDSIRVRVNLQSTRAPSISPVYLQVWNATTASWETIASNNTAAANTDFDLEHTIEANQSDYYDSDFEVAFRVYQLAD